MTSNRPAKELVRALMAERTRAKTPPPSPDEIRRQLGWFLVPDRKPR